MRLREPLQAAAPCAEGVAEIHEDPDEYDPLDEANDMQLQVLLWEAAGRIRLEERAEDARLEVAPNEEAQRELDEIDARNARAAANVVEPAAEPMQATHTASFFFQLSRSNVHFSYPAVQSTPRQRASTRHKNLQEVELPRRLLSLRL